MQLLKARPVDESAVLAQVDQVLNREREIKRAQISLLVRIKNQLNETQQNKLMELRHNPSRRNAQGWQRVARRKLC